MKWQALRLQRKRCVNQISSKGLPSSLERCLVLQQRANFLCFSISSYLRSLPKTRNLAFRQARKFYSTYLADPTFWLYCHHPNMCFTDTPAHRRLRLHRHGFQQVYDRYREASGPPFRAQARQQSRYAEEVSTRFSTNEKNQARN